MVVVVVPASTVEDPLSAAAVVRGLDLPDMRPRDPLMKLEKEKRELGPVLRWLVSAVEPG
jgi:hypothetical protein